MNSGYINFGKWTNHYKVTSYQGNNRCIKCSNFGSQVHHITYEPESVELLCSWCHGNITYLNMLASRFILGRALNNQDREYINRFFLQLTALKEETVVKNFTVAMRDWTIVEFLFRGYN